MLMRCSASNIFHAARKVVRLWIGGPRCFDRCGFVAFAQPERYGFISYSKVSAKFGCCRMLSTSPAEGVFSPSIRCEHDVGAFLTRCVPRLGVPYLVTQAAALQGRVVVAFGLAKIEDGVGGGGTRGLPGPPRHLPAWEEGAHRRRAVAVRRVSLVIEMAVHVFRSTTRLAVAAVTASQHRLLAVPPPAPPAGGVTPACATRRLRLLRRGVPPNSAPAPHRRGTLPVPARCATEDRVDGVAADSKRFPTSGPNAESV